MRAPAGPRGRASPQPEPEQVGTMDPVRTGCALILLGLSVNVEPLSDRDASCDGAFDVYFVLDK